MSQYSIDLSGNKIKHNFSENLSFYVNSIKDNYINE